MCGIAGWFVPPQSAPDDDTLHLFASALRHRGPDDKGIFSSPAHGVGLGHRRLSIIDLSSASHQPMLALGGQVALSYNGELYNFRELREDLRALGESFSTSGDTEVVLRAYLRWGVAAFERFAGMFAIALWDARSAAMHLVRDPMGIKPLYWMPFRGGMAFASEARAFQALPDVQLALRDGGVAQYLEFGYVIDDADTIFDNVHKVAPGQRLEVRAGQVVSTNYYQPTPRSSGAEVSFDQRRDVLYATLNRVVGQHLIADVPVAMLLSGGIDSSVLAALAARHTQVETLTMAFEGAAVDERGPARDVAKFVGAHHNEVFITADQVVDEAVNHAGMFDDLFADWGTFTTRLLYRRARELGYKVVLVGEGADELFGGYDVFDVSGHLGPLARFRLYQRYAGRRHGACRKLFDSVLGPYLLASDDAFDAVRMFESRRQLPNQYVMKVDKASMAESVEARAPYLDRRIADIAYATPRDMLLRSGENKHLLREMARHHQLLPEGITRRPKYGSPLASSWMDTNPAIRQLAVDMMLAPGSLTERYGLKRAIRRYLLDGRAGDIWPGGISIYRNLAWKLLLMELWATQVLRTDVAQDRAVTPTVLGEPAFGVYAATAKECVYGLVTTVIPVFNRGQLLQRAVDSVLEQTYRPIEIVIVDDGSTDDTGAIAEQLASLHPDIVRVVQQANAGPGVARQAGIDAARGEFVQFLDSDDRFLPEKTQLLVNALRTDPNADIAYGGALTVFENGERAPDGEHRTNERHKQLFPAILGGRIWPTNVPIYRRTALHRIGPWPDLRQLEDLCFDAMAGAANMRLVFVDRPVAEVWAHSQEHLGHEWRRNARTHRARVAGYLRVLELAELAQVDAQSSEMQRFCRTLFLEARMAAASGLADEAHCLVRAAGRHATTFRWQYWAFEMVASLVGWRRAGQFSDWVERLR